MRKFLNSFLLLVFLAGVPAVQAAASAPRKCFEIHGRAILYRGDGFFAIWHVGTHHVFFPANKASYDLLCSYMDCDSPRKQPALFADFIVCPTKPFKKGAAQPVQVKKVTHPVVVPEWPPKKGSESSSGAGHGSST